VARDEWIPGFAAAGLDALEAYHTNHDVFTAERYIATARRLGLAISGGSDFHADDAHGAAAPGAVCLPQPEYDALLLRVPRLQPGARAAIRATASGADTSS
jgi:hypothetical protein